MESDHSRSEAVVESFKRRKLTISALRSIQQVLLGFKKDRETDQRIAGVGLLLIVVIAAIAAYFFFGTESITLP
ncbi:MAG: hypothetical protein ACI9LO_000978 [Planctomycetota bacterium]|jgi:hypothetical protein